MAGVSCALAQIMTAMVVGSSGWLGIFRCAGSVNPEFVHEKLTKALYSVRVSNRLLHPIEGTVRASIRKMNELSSGGDIQHVVTTASMRPIRNPQAAQRSRDV